MPDCCFNLFPLKLFFHCFLPTFSCLVPYKLSLFPANGLPSTFSPDLTWAVFILPLQVCHRSLTSHRQELIISKKECGEASGSVSFLRSFFLMLRSGETCLNCHYYYFCSYTDRSKGTVMAILPPGSILNLVVIQPYNDCNSWHSQPAVIVLEFYLIFLVAWVCCLFCCVCNCAPEEIRRQDMHIMIE